MGRVRVRVRVRRGEYTDRWVWAPGLQWELELADGVHEFVGDLLVDFLEAGLVTGGGFGAEGGEGQGRSEDDRDGARPGETVVPAHGLEGTHDPDGDHGGIRLDDGETDAGAGSFHFSVRGSGAFRKEEDRRAGTELVEDGLESGTATAVAIDRNGLEAADDEPADRGFEQGLPRERMDASRQDAPDERRIEVADVIGGEDGGTDAWHVMGTDNAEPEVAPGEHAHEPGREAVVERAAGEFFVGRRRRFHATSTRSPS